MDNRIFNVNGEGKDLLAAALELAFRQSGMNNSVGYRITQTSGIVLLWSIRDDNDHKFMTPLSAAAVAPMVYEWLQTPEARSMPHTEWDIDCDHDGDNSHGWRVSCGDWGHVDGDWHGIVSIQHAFMWHGK